MGEIGRNSTKEMPTAGLRDKIDRDRQTRGVGKDLGSGRIQGVNKMYTEANSQEGKSRNLGVGRWFNGGRKYCFRGGGR